MPARRVRKRTTRRRKPQGVIAKYAPQLASVGIKGLKMALGLNTETHYTDTLSTGNFYTTTGTVALLSAVAQGDDITNRTGRSIRLTHFNYRIRVLRGAGATQSAWVRQIIFADMNAVDSAAGALPAVVDVLATANIDSFRAMAYDQGRFKVISDVTRIIGVPGDRDNFFYDGSWSPEAHHIDYVGTTGNQAAAGKGNLYILFIADQVASNAMTIGYSTRIKFVDN